ncbi:multicopper oxidase [Sorangium sp. So ce327]|uniref:multicopper oxidase family protein n=1 Tax=Sorangium sp. So ce327 TaxID=3133301 RepID=UPI003F6481E9
MFTRRQFFKIGAGGTTLLLLDRVGGSVRTACAAIPGGTPDPLRVDKYVTPLLVPPAMPRAGKITLHGGRFIDYYEIAVRQFEQQILPPPYPATTVWGYGPKVAQGEPRIFHAPSLTIEADHERPVRIKWINELVDAGGNYLPHLLPVDQTLHWANPPGGMAGRDMRPELDEMQETPGRYTGPVPIVTHVHGAVSVGDESDGYAEAWYLPDAANLPEGYATEGTWYDFFAAKALAKFGVTWGPGFAIAQYPNAGRASTQWYHDHTLGMTRVNVYAGPAGFYLVRGGQGDVVLDARTHRPAVLPGPAPSRGDAPNIHYREIPIAIQDRSFNSDGSLFYPDTRAFFGDITGPFIPQSDVPPIWNPEFFGNMIMVNGNTWPFLAVKQRRYRFRFLNGCQSRFLILDFNRIRGVEVWMIGNEGGFLDSPVNLTATNGNRLLMAPAERADLIVDFGRVPKGRHILANVGPDEPFGGGAPVVDFAPADRASTGQIMAFDVMHTPGCDHSTPPRFLLLPPAPPLPRETTRTRPLVLSEVTSVDFPVEFPDAPVAALLGRSEDGKVKLLAWEDDVTENPQVEDTEVWELHNLTGDAHPIHIHETVFEVVNRQALDIEAPPEGQLPPLVGAARPPEPWETGYKDTVIAYPGEVTRIRARFLTAGQYVWHCHILEHEDNEMMRPYRIGPVQRGQPT